MGEQRKSFGLGGIVRLVRLSNSFQGLVNDAKGRGWGYFVDMQNLVKPEFEKLSAHSYAFVLHSTKFRDKSRNLVYWMDRSFYK